MRYVRDQHTKRGPAAGATVTLVSAQALLGVLNAYLLVLLGAAVSERGRPRPATSGSDRLRFLVVIPAHDEEGGIEATLASLQRLNYPQDRLELIVVADNCQDATAALATSMGATVWERDDRSHPGKGRALAWAFERAWRERPLAQAVALVDADCSATPNLLLAMGERLRSGADAVQVDNAIANGEESTASALRYAAFVLINTIRPLGKTRLGLSCGLSGTGMGFSRALLERQPWKAVSLAEDREYHLRLVAAGERVVFASEAAVSSPVATSLERASEQQLRWEAGSFAAVPEWTAKLVKKGLRERDPNRVHAGLEPLVPPQALLALVQLGLFTAAIALRSRLALGVAAANLVGQASFVLGGLALVNAPRAAYRALALAPVLIVCKVGLYARLMAGRGPRRWVRSERPLPATEQVPPEPAWPHLARRSPGGSRPGRHRPRSTAGDSGTRRGAGRGSPPRAS